MISLIKKIGVSMLASICADPVVALYVAKVTRRRSAGVVDENVGLWRCRKHGATACFGCDIANHRRHADAMVPPNIVGEEGEHSHVARVDNKVDPLTRQRDRDSTT